MRLINVNVFLAFEKNIQDGELHIGNKELLVERYGSWLAETKYAILSHCWGLLGEGEREVQFHDMQGLNMMGLDDPRINTIRASSGYKKILDTCKQASEDGFEWVWVDTCCIDKTSSSELSEAINSMYQWYAKSELCYAYIHDVDDSSLPEEEDEVRFPLFDGWPKYFSRGWTLQELIAPREVRFFNKYWGYMGDKRTLASALNRITRIPEHILADGLSSGRPSVAQIMSWAAKRTTTREEDRAYSLLGLFNVYMPMLYGEGKNAFQRLQLEIIRMSNDQSIFAWGLGPIPIKRVGNILADDPSFFADCHDVVKLEPDAFAKQFEKDFPEDRNILVDERLGSFLVTNRGIQISLPLRPYRQCPSVFLATLACRTRKGPVTINLAFLKSNYYRYFASHGMPWPVPEFRQLYLTYRDETRPHFTFHLDDNAVSHYSFKRLGATPSSVTDDPSVFTLSSAKSLFVVAYGQENSNACFAIGFGYCFGQEWVHVMDDQIMGHSKAGRSWEGYAEEVYRTLLRKTNAEHAQCMAEAQSDDSPFYIKHMHLALSTLAVSVICGRRERSSVVTVIVDVDRCPGCCHSPLRWKPLHDITDDGDMPGLMRTIRQSPGIDLHDLRIDGTPMEFTLGMASVKLGDYGRYLKGSLEPEGNIFTGLQMLAEKLGTNPADIEFSPVKREVHGADSTFMTSSSVTTRARTSIGRPRLGVVLHNPVCLSLPNNQRFLSLLKSVASDLIGKCLVTRVVECSGCHITGKFRAQVKGTEEVWRRYRKVWGEGSALDGTCVCLVEPHTVTPLYSVAQPFAWRRDTGDVETRAHLEEIRKKFCDLLNLHPSTDDDLLDLRDSPAMKEANAIQFFQDMFALGHLNDYVGRVGFIRQLTTLTARSNSDHESRVKDNYLTTAARSPVKSAQSPFRWDSGQSTGIPDSHTTVLVASLRNNIQRWSVRKRKVQLDERSISSSLGAPLLPRIRAAYIRGWESLHRDKEKDGDDKEEEIPVEDDSDSRISVQSVVREIKALQELLYTTKDEYRQRALEEDIVGKILWLCWCGISSEVDQIPNKVVNCLLEDVEVDHKDLDTIALRLWDFGRVFKDALNTPAPDDKQLHLRRVMADAKAGISKYQMLLDGRAKGIAGDTSTSDLELGVKDGTTTTTHSGNQSTEPYPLSCANPYLDRDIQPDDPVAYTETIHLAREPDITSLPSPQASLTTFSPSTSQSTLSMGISGTDTCTLTAGFKVGEITHRKTPSDQLSVPLLPSITGPASLKHTQEALIPALDLPGAWKWF